MIYVLLILGGTVFGVLGASHAMYTLLDLRNPRWLVALVHLGTGAVPQPIQCLSRARDQFHVLMFSLLPLFHPNRGRIDVSQVQLPAALFWNSRRQRNSDP